jgi:hypothetical protein
MQNLRLVVTAMLLVPALAAQQPAAPPPAPPAAPPTIPATRPGDVASIDAILGALYDVISGPAGTRDWDRFRSLFAPGARLIPARPKAGGGAEAVVLDVDAYIQQTDLYFQQHGFFEKEIARQTEQFGNIAHAFSTYASYHAARDSVPFTRGINSIQLLKDADRWWVVSIFWDAERRGQTIPPAYLPASGRSSARETGASRAS